MLENLYVGDKGAKKLKLMKYFVTFVANQINGKWVDMIVSAANFVMFNSSSKCHLNTWCSTLKHNYSSLLNNIIMTLK